MGLESIKGVNAQTQAQGTETKLYDTKAKRKAAINQAISDFMKYGSSDGAKIYSDKKEYKAALKEQKQERKAFIKQMKAQGKTKDWAKQEFDNKAQRIALAKDEAKKYITNEQHREEFETFNENTTVYADKKAYKAAKKETEAARKELYKDLRAQGLSRKEAKAKVNAQIQDVELAARSARKGFAKLGLVENDGTLGEKALDYMVSQANKGNDKQGEATNYHYSLNERRATKADEKAQGNRLTLHALGKMADAVGLHKEKNLTGPMRIAAAAAIVTGSTGLGALTGGITSASTAGAIATSASSSIASGPAGSAQAAADAAAEAGSFAGVRIGGALIGATAGTVIAGLAVPFIKDPGKKPIHVFAPNQPKVEEPEVETPKVEPKVETPKPQPCPPEYEDAYCSHKVKYGDNWYNVAKASYKVNGKKLEDGSKELKAIIKAQQLMYGIEDNSKGKFFKVGDEFKLYTDYSTLLNDEEVIKKHPQLQILKDAQIEADCGADYKAGKVIKGKFGLITNKGAKVQNEYDCYGNKVGTRVVNE